MIQNIKYIIISFTLISCSSYYKVEKENDCTQKFSTKNLTKITGIAKEVTGTIASYSVTGAAYTGEFIVKFIRGIVETIIYCAPTIPIAILASTNTYLSRPHFVPGLCVKQPTNPYKKEVFGTKVYHSTKKWRCPLYSKLSESVRNIAQCHYQKKTKEDISLAVEQLQHFSRKQKYQECIKEEDYKKNKDMLRRYQESLEDLT